MPSANKSYPTSTAWAAAPHLGEMMKTILDMLPAGLPLWSTEIRTAVTADGDVYIKLYVEAISSNKRSLSLCWHTHEDPRGSASYHAKKLPAPLFELIYGDTKVALDPALPAVRIPTEAWDYAVELIRDLDRDLSAEKALSEKEAASRG